MMCIILFFEALWFITVTGYLFPFSLFIFYFFLDCCASLMLLDILLMQRLCVYLLDINIIFIKK
jgi:hypothetical protein